MQAADDSDNRNPVHDMIQQAANDEVGLKGRQMGLLLSSRLIEGDIYTRAKLAEILESKDMTINTGIFNQETMTRFSSS